ncbi:Zn-ribbon domain-containing OB-fold protein [Natronobeatus ordinarius]|uniref:Zn-ribbon domain-containing OB-fold protein n=1 Tax=Natronobeatus ordinarius TaxID=2963433 RepID=UPI0020CF3E68|nr:OB-fold domain-containing protein [Natronobeatus ordinarius]
MFRPRHWRERTRTERLLARECNACGYVSFPERPEGCVRCGALEPGWEPTELCERGIVRSYVVQHRLPAAFETPLPVAIVDMPQQGDGEPARVYGLFTETDPAEIEIGMEADADFRRLFEIEGLPMYAFVFKQPRGDR